jgi:hypothetical protein
MKIKIDKNKTFWDILNQISDKFYILENNSGKQTEFAMLVKCFFLGESSLKEKEPEEIIEFSDLEDLPVEVIELYLSVLEKRRRELITARILKNIKNNNNITPIDLIRYFESSTGKNWQDEI